MEASTRDVFQVALSDLISCVDKWGTLHRRGEALLNSFSSDIASVVTEPSEEGGSTAMQEVRERMGGISARRDGSLSSAAIQAEKRLADIRAVMDELEQLLTKMEDTVSAAKRHAASCKPEELTSRGRQSSQPSSMDRLHMMAECLSLHQAEFELKETIVSALTFSMSSLELTTYIMSWKTKPFASEWKRAAAVASTY